MATTLVPYLTFAGNTREAFAFYEKVLGARIDAMLRYADMPRADMPAEGCASGEGAPTGDGIMHACLTLPGGAQLFAGDAPPGMPFDGIRGAMLALSYDAVDEAEQVFGRLGEGGQVTMPLAPTFWAKSFGMLTDRFGVAWAINGGPIPVGK